MAVCEVCGNDYEMSFQVVTAGSFYCCAHCAHAEGAEAIVDNAAHAAH